MQNESAAMNVADGGAAERVFTVEVTDDVVAATAKRLFSVWKFTLLSSLVFAAMAAIVCIWREVDLVSLLPQMLLVVPMTIGAVGYIHRLSSIHAARRSMEDLPHRSMQTTLKPACLIVRYATATIEIRWETIVRLDLFPDLWILRTKAGYHAIPVANVPQTALEYIESHCRQAGVCIKRKG